MQTSSYETHRDQYWWIQNWDTSSGTWVNWNQMPVHTLEAAIERILKLQRYTRNTNGYSEWTWRLFNQHTKESIPGDALLHG